MNLQNKLNPIIEFRQSDQAPRNRFNTYSLWLLLAGLLIVASGCSPLSSVEGTAKSFVRTMSSGNSDMAANYVCQDGGVALLIGIKINWSRDSYDTLENDGLNARVNVKGRIQIPDSEIKDFFDKVKSVIHMLGAESPIGVLDTENLPVAMTLIVDLDFDNLQLKNNNGSWCVQQESIVDFYEYLAKLVVNQIAQEQE